MSTAPVTPSLAAQLGRIAAPPHGAPFESVRLALLEALITARHEGSLTHETWQRAFDHAARSLRLRVIEHAERELRAAAAQSRFPRRRLAALLPDAEAADALLHRLLAEGIPLERFERQSDTDEMRHRRALAMEAAWEGAAAIAKAESLRWSGVAATVAAWRRPTAPVWVASALLLGGSLLVAAWLGGELPAPEWFDPIGRIFWGLPWP